MSLLLGPGQEMYKMSLVHLEVPENEKVLHTYTESMMGFVKGTQKPIEEFSMAKAGMICAVR